MVRMSRTCLVIVVEGKLLGHLLSYELTRLVCPGAGDVAHRVTTATQDDDGHAKALDVANAVGMAVHAQIEASKPVAGETVASALEHDGFWAVVGHDRLDDWLEDVAVGLIGYAVAQREVDRVILAGANTNVTQFTSTGEVLAILMEGHSHDTIGRVESLLDTISMVHVDVDVQNALLVPQKLDDAEDNV